MSSAASASSETTRLLCVGSTVVDVNIQGLTRFPVPDVEFTQASDVAHEQPARLLLVVTIHCRHPAAAAA